LPFYTSYISAGFPSPADDYKENSLDLNDHLIKHPSATFFMRAKGYAMMKAGIFDNDLLVVDRSIKPIHKKIIIAVYNGEYIVRRLVKQGKNIQLIAENPDYPTININEECEFLIWGVVTCVIHLV
jgi:DNA polymerase V